MNKKFYVYIVSSYLNKKIYIGVTSDLKKRIWEHKNKVVEGHTEKYNKNRLVYFEIFDDIENAIKREKQLKNWHRPWKINLIEERNPDWKDLFEEICA